MNIIRENTKKANNDSNNFRVILLTYPNIIEFNAQKNNNDGSQFPMRGTIDQIGKDIKKIKDIEVDHIILEYTFSTIGRDINKMIDITKQFSKFAK